MAAAEDQDDPSHVPEWGPASGTTWLHTLLSGHPDVPPDTAERSAVLTATSSRAGVVRGIFSGRNWWVRGHRHIPTVPYDQEVLMSDRDGPAVREASGDAAASRRPRVLSVRFLLTAQLPHRSKSSKTRPRALDGPLQPASPEVPHRFDGVDPARRLRRGGPWRRHGASHPAEFLGIPEGGFPAATERVNASTMPRYPRIANLAVKTGRRLRRRHLESIVDLAGRSGVRRFMTSGTQVPKLDVGVKSELSRRYLDEFDALEELLGIDLSCWKDRPAKRRTGDAAPV